MKKRGGFTLIELSLSLVFIAILSLTVVLLIQNTMASYRRGLVLNQVNTVGMDLIDDIRSSVQYATSDPATRMCEMYYGKGSDQYNACMADGAYSFISVTRKAIVKVNNEPLNGGQPLPVYGAFCTGTYTYIWNSGYFDSTDVETRKVVKSLVSEDEVPRATIGMSGVRIGGFYNAGVDYADALEEAVGAADLGIDKIRLLKVYDNERSVCVNAMVNKNGGSIRPYTKNTEYENEANNEFVFSSRGDMNNDSMIDLLEQENANDLVLYDFYVSEPAESATRQNIFYAASFILGTKRGGIDIKQVGNNCKPPTDYDSDLDYCAINKFNFAVQAGGE